MLSTTTAEWLQNENICYQANVYIISVERLKIFVQWQHAVAVFNFQLSIDFEKAYSMWKVGIMRDLHNTGLSGWIPCFVEGFLKILRSMFDLVHVSQTFYQAMGVP